MQERGRVDYIQQDEEDFKVSATRHLVYAAHNRLTDAATDVVYGAGRAQGAVDRHPLVSVDEPDKGHSEVAPAEEV